MHLRVLLYSSSVMYLMYIHTIEIENTLQSNKDILYQKNNSHDRKYVLN